MITNTEQNLKSFMATRITSLVKNEFYSYKEAKIKNLFSSSVNLEPDNSGKIINLSFNDNLLPTRGINVGVNIQKLVKKSRDNNVKFMGYSMIFKDFQIDISRADLFDNRIKRIKIQNFNLDTIPRVLNHIQKALHLLTIRSALLSFLFGIELNNKSGSAIEEKLNERIVKFYKNSSTQLETKNLQNFIIELNNLKGLGPGFTPSGDDFYIGFYSASLVIKQKYNFIIPYNYFEKGNESMSEVSRCQFEDIKKGYLPEVLILIFKSIFDPTLENLLTMIALIKKYGHTSGEDYLAGILFFLRCLYKFDLYV